MIPLTSENLVSVIWTGEQFVALGEYGIILTSPDGDVWTVKPARVAASTSKKASFSTPATSIGFTNGIYVVSTLSGLMFKSTDLSIWTYSEIKNIDDLPPSEAFLSIATRNGRFVAGGKDASHSQIGIMGLLATSTDGSTWDKQGIYGHVLKVKYEGNQWIAIGTDQNRMTSPNGTSWTKQGYTNAGTYRSVAWNGMRYLYSHSCLDMIWKNGKLVACFPGGLGTSVDGGVFDIRQPVSQAVFYYDETTGLSKYGCLAENDTCIIAAGGGGSLFRSVDGGLTWNITGANGRVPTVTLDLIGNDNIYFDGAIVTGNITSDGGYTVTDKGFVISLMANPTINDIKISSGDGSNSFTSQSSLGLNPLTIYHIRGYAQNELGTGYSADTTFTTKTTKPSVVLYELTEPGATSVTISASVTSSGGVVVSEKGIVYSKVTTVPTLNDSFIMCGDSVGAFSTNLEGLKLDSTYYIRAYATNALGIQYSNTLIFKTLATNRGASMRSNKVHVYEKRLGNNVVKITLIGYMKDHTHAPMDILRQVIWTVEDPTICRIEDAQVIPLKDGTTTITASITLPGNRVIQANGTVIVGNYRLDRISISDMFLSVAAGTIIDIIPK